MRRSSRVILLLGIFLAVGAFILIVFLGGGGRQAASPTPAVAQIVKAAVDIPQGTTITESMVTTTEVALSAAPGDSFALPEQVVGRTARRTVATGAYLPQAAITGTQGVAVDVARELKPGERAVALQVDEVSGVGLLIQNGDRVDVIINIEKANFPIGIPITIRPGSSTVTSLPDEAPGFAGTDGFQIVTIDELNPTSVKLIVQNARVVQVLTAAPPAPTGNQPTAAPAGPTASTPMVIVAVTAQQAEVLRFALLEGRIYMALRSPEDAEATPDVTTGVVLRTLIEEYGVLPPRLVFVERE